MKHVVLSCLAWETLGCILSFGLLRVVSGDIAALGLVAFAVVLFPKAGRYLDYAFL